MNYKQTKERIEELAAKVARTTNFLISKSVREEFSLSFYYNDKEQLCLRDLPMDFLKQYLTTQLPIWAEELAKLQEAIKAAEIVVEGYTKS